jgi:hypothetical protein
MGSPPVLSHIRLAVFFYVALDGFDLGVGMLYSPLYATLPPHQRAAALARSASALTSRDSSRRGSLSRVVVRQQIANFRYRVSAKADVAQPCGEARLLGRDPMQARRAG